MIDRRRAAVYAAESMVTDMVDRAAEVVFHGSVLTPELDRKFGQVADVERYLLRLRDQPWGAADVPVPVVRVRRGAAKATWEEPGVIALPDAVWARREMVVLHEYTHHVVWYRSQRRDTSHGPDFCRTFAEFVRRAVGPATGLLLTDAFFSAGLFDGCIRPRDVSRSR